MKRITGPRPLSITLFAIALLLVALAGLAEGLSDIEGAALRLSLTLPWIGWDRGATVFAIFTEFFIALIPLLWIYFFAVRGARWVVLGFGLIKLLFAIRPLLATLQFGAFEPLLLLEPVLLAIALVMLFTPSASRWLRSRKEVDPATFN